MSPLNGVAHHEPSHRAAVQRVIGLLMMFFSLSMLPPLFVALGYGDGGETAFLLGFFIVLVAGVVVWLPVRRAHAELRVRDGVLITVLFWTVLGLVGAVPLRIATDAWNNWTEAIFESVSGLTTTGATVAVGLDHLPHALNYYRA